MPKDKLIEQEVEGRTIWNYRVIKFSNRESDGEHWYEIREVYYTDEKPTSYTAEAEGVGSDDIDGLKWELERMREALGKPVLDEACFVALRKYCNCSA